MTHLRPGCSKVFFLNSALFPSSEYLYVIEHDQDLFKQDIQWLCHTGILLKMYKITSDTFRHGHQILQMANIHAPHIVLRLLHALTDPSPHSLISLHFIEEEAKAQRS